MSRGKFGVFWGFPPMCAALALVAVRGVLMERTKELALALFVYVEGMGGFPSFAALASAAKKKENALSRGP